MMMKRLFSSESQSITGAALILGAASFLSRIVGVVRDRILAHQFGAGAELDVYTAAFRIPDFLYNIIIVGALSAGFIPLFLEIFHKEKKEAWKFTNTVMTLTFISLGLLSIITFFVLPFFIHILVPGFLVEAQRETLQLTRIMLLSPILLGLSAVVSSVLQSLRSFFVYSLAPILYNIGIIVGAACLVPVFGLRGLAYGVVLGALFHLLIQIPLVFQFGYKFSLNFSFRSKQIKKLLFMMIPRTLTLATVQINVVIVTLFASTLTAGSIAVYNFASNIASLPVGIIGISFALAAFPTLSELFAKKEMKEFSQHLSNVVRQIIFFIIPLTIIFILLRAQIIRVLLGTGEFDWEDTIITAQTVGMFALSLFAQCLIPLLIRAFYAVQNTRTPLVITFFSTGISLLLSYILKDTLGVAGLALGISIGSVLQLTFLWIALKKEIDIVEEKIYLVSAAKISVAAICMAVVTQTLKYPISLLVNMEKFWGILLQGIVAGGIGLLVYGVICYALKLNEMLVLLGSLQRRWLKISKVEEISEVK